MPNELVTYEQELTALTPRFEQVLAGIGVAPERIVRTVLTSLERTPKLLECTRPSIISAAMSAACLGLEVDGTTGQAFLIPFEDRKAGIKRAQLVIGYRGMATMAARSGYTINAAVVREGDTFDFQEGTGGHIHHCRKLGGEEDRRIIAAWATASHAERPDILSILSLDELKAVKAKSSGASMSGSPWKDPKVGFPAMCKKTAIRRLAATMPLNVLQIAAAMDTHYEELGKYSRVDPDKGLVVEGEAVETGPLPARQGPDEAPPLSLDAPVYKVDLADGSTREFGNTDEWRAFMLKGFSAVPSSERLKAFKGRNEANLTAAEASAYDTVQAIEAAYDERMTQLVRVERDAAAQGGVL